MRNTLPLLALVVLVAALAAGCANTERKLGRGITNMTEFVRLGEMRRSIEQNSLLDGPEIGGTTGFINGFDRSVARTGIGIYEVVTCPIPPYHPVCTDYLTPAPVYPDSYRPGLPDTTTVATDVNLGYSGGEVLHGVGGSHFVVFPTH